MLAPLLAETAPAADRSLLMLDLRAAATKLFASVLRNFRCCPRLLAPWRLSSITPELRLIDGRIIRNLDDAALFAPEHEPRPGIDRRDEVLHAIERARNGEEAHAAAHLFLQWLEELELVE
jgi:hypothetical protein